MRTHIFERVLAGCLCLVMAAGLLTGCGGSSTSYSGYKEHTEVEGVTFSIPSAFTDGATSVSEISANGDFKSDTTYEFKNGTDTYLLFNMEGIVIIVRKGTDFGFFDTDDKVSCLKNSSILSVQLTLPERAKKLDYEEATSGNIYRLIGTVKAEAVITRNVYGDFIGKVSSICIGNDEWTLFAGVPGTRYNRIDKEQQKVLEAIAESFRPVTTTEDGASTESTEAASDAGSTTKVISGGSKKNYIPSASSSASSENAAEEETKKTEPTDSSASVSSEPSDVNSQTEESSTGSAENEVKTEIKEQVSKTETTGPAETSEESSESEDQTDSDPENGIHMSNQREATVVGDSKVSDIYSMLSVGDKGKAQVISDEASEIITVSVTLNKVVTGQEAIDTIKEYCNSGKSGYSYEEPPTGTKWVLASYDVDYEGNSERPSVNSKLRGLNGDKLYVNGIGYSSRTYDMNYQAKDGKNFMIYYAVPINCKEYALVFGDGSTDNLYQAAYFRIAEE